MDVFWVNCRLFRGSNCKRLKFGAFCCFAGRVARAVFYCNARAWGVLLLHFILLFVSLICWGCKEGVIFRIVLLRMAKKKSFLKKIKGKEKRQKAKHMLPGMWGL